MDMSRLLKYIKEVWGENIKGEKFEIIELPEMSMRDVDSLRPEKGEIRFIADSRDKKIYIWDAMKEIHSRTWDDYINANGTESSLAMKGVILEGVAKKKGGKYKMIESDQMDAYFGYEPDSMRDFKKNFKWVDRYINVTDALDDWIDYNS
jgi:hypothetical protein